MTEIEMVDLKDLYWVGWMENQMVAMKVAMMVKILEMMMVGWKAVWLEGY